MAPDNPRSNTLIERMTDEVSGYDAEAMERFKAAHGGLTPIQFALSNFPTARRAVEKVWPHVCPPEEDSR
jgi:hypothetical protein